MSLSIIKYDIVVFYKEEQICHIEVRGKEVNFKNFCNLPVVFYPFGVRTQANYNDLEEFFEERCFPKERVNCKEILHDLGLDYYEPELICRKTHGVQFDDFIWLQFSDEPKVKWNDIKLRD